MGDRRMISRKIVASAIFLKMPATSQNLYFHLLSAADDDGVVEAYPIINMCKANEDDLRVLVGKEFVTVLNEDLVTYEVFRDGHLYLFFYHIFRHNNKKLAKDMKLNINNHSKVKKYN